MFNNVRQLGVYIWDILGCGQRIFSITPNHSKTDTASPNYSPVLLGKVSTYGMPLLWTIETKDKIFFFKTRSNIEKMKLLLDR